MLTITAIPSVAITVALTPASISLFFKALEAMQKMADGKATKIIIPSEIQGMAGLAASVKELVKD